MKRFLMPLALALCPVTVLADGNDPVIDEIVTAHILPRFEALAQQSATLAEAAQADCSPGSDPLRVAFLSAFDAWVSVSHLRFGPTEIEDRGFALAFWPDSRGKTPRALGKLIMDQDPIGLGVEDYADMSIAARGFYALEFLLFDEALSTAGGDAYRCRLLQTIAADTADMTSDIWDGWPGDYAERLLNPSIEGTYRSDEEVLQELLKATSTGLEFTAESRLGRPMGTFEKPRPTRAEAWRSGQSAHHVSLSLAVTRDLAVRLAGDDAELVSDLNGAFGRAQQQLADLDDPIFASVVQPQGRLKIEVVQQSINTARTIIQDRLGPKLGVAAGFNALDGD
ncbi:peptidase M75 [Sulfitobacter sp. SK012]|uniref:imelysin family protein n=1 Tax=Sulfitobacter sp. SK012 TaxID=1389005 RepID=UPI000E0B4299|nr:imelysin family protein [Sulfitobacter sp. SK012]AXI44724.1 peptidase M75 [Sulfitobacter sp. SK012]